MRPSAALHDWCLTVFLFLLTLATAALLSGPAQAQVVRCTDMRTGAIAYTDGQCPRGTSAREVQARQTPEEIHQQRAQAAQALAEKQQRLQAEADQARLSAERDAQRQREQAERAAAARPALPDYARSPECARSRRTLDLTAASIGTGNALQGQDPRLQTAQHQMELDCLGPQGYAEVAKNRPSNPPVVWYAPTQLRPPPEHPPHGRPPGARPPPRSRPPPWFTHCPGERCDDGPGRRRPRP